MRALYLHSTNMSSNPGTNLHIKNQTTHKSWDSNNSTW